MNAALRIPALVVWLTSLWLALWHDLSWANLLSGLAISLAIVSVLHLERGDTRVTYFRPHWAIYYVVHVIGSLVVSNLKLAREVLRGGSGTFTAIVAVPMRGGSEAVVNLVSNSITLTPGTMTVDVESLGDVDGDGAEDGVVLYVHSMFAQDVEQVRGSVLRLEELALKAFGSPSDYERAHVELVAHTSAVASSEESPASPARRKKAP